EERKLSVKIPAGVDEGSRLRVPAEGESGYNGGPPGDLYVFISVEDHEKFTRRDYDIHSEQAISVSQAVLGAEIKTDTIDGPETLKVPAGAQPNQSSACAEKACNFCRARGAATTMYM